MNNKEITKYFLLKDNKNLFNNNIIIYKNKKYFEKEIRLNIYLFLTQDIYKKIHNKNFKNISEEFLDKLWLSLENASINDLISIVEENPKWSNKRAIDEYKNRYKGIIEALQIS